MSLTLERKAKTAPIIHLRPDFLAAPDAQPPMQVIRRNGTVSRFDASKISVAMTKAFLAVEGHTPLLRAACRRCAQIGLTPVFPEAENPFPWMSEAMDLKKEKNFFETRVIEYQNGGALTWD